MTVQYQASLFDTSVIGPALGALAARVERTQLSEGAWARAVRRSASRLDTVISS